MSDALKASIDRYRARLFAVEAERDEALARLAALTAERDATVAYAEQLISVANLAAANLQARVAALTAALEEYGRHNYGCDAGPDTCTCGYRAALDAAGGA